METKSPQTCEECGKENLIDATFCTNCGTKLNDSDSIDGLQYDLGRTSEQKPKKKPYKQNLILYGGLLVLGGGIVILTVFLHSGKEKNTLALSFLQSKTPTVTITPTMTTTPTETPIPEGWKVVASDDIRFSIPEDYINQDNINAENKETLETIGGNIEDVFYGLNDEIMATNSSADEIIMELNLWAVNMDNESLVMFGKSDITSPIEMKYLINEFIASSFILGESNNNITSEDKIFANQISIYKVRVTDNSSFLGHFYFFQTDDEFWMGIYTTNTNDDSEVEADFEQSIQSLALIN